MTHSAPNFPIQQDLIDDTQALAKALNLSWSQLITLALRDFIRRYSRRQQLTEQINAAYGDDLNEEETEIIRSMRVSHRRIVEGEW